MFWELILIVVNAASWVFIMYSMTIFLGGSTSIKLIILSLLALLIFLFSFNAISSSGRFVDQKKFEAITQINFVDSIVGKYIPTGSVVKARFISDFYIKKRNQSVFLTTSEECVIEGEVKSTKGTKAIIYMYSIECPGIKKTSISGFGIDSNRKLGIETEIVSENNSNYFLLREGREVDVIFISPVKLNKKESKK